MRDKTKETAEAIDQTRMDMAGVEGTLTWVQHLAQRNRDGDMDDIKRIVQEQRAILTALRKGLNKARFDNTFSPLGFELESSDADPWKEVEGDICYSPICNKAGVDA
jgi:hypothetical protein